MRTEVLDQCPHLLRAIRLRQHRCTFLKMSLKLVGLVRLSAGFEKCERYSTDVVAAEGALQHEPLHDLGVGVDVDVGGAERGVSVSRLELRLYVLSGTAARLATQLEILQDFVQQRFE